VSQTEQLQRKTYRKEYPDTPKTEWSKAPAYYEVDYGNGWSSVWYHYTAHPDKLDPSWAEEMARSYPGGMDGAPWRAEMEIDWGARSGELVYPCWDRATHIIEPFELDPYWPRYRSIDPGWHNPTAVLWGCLSPDGILYLYREHYRSGWTVPQHAQKVRGASAREEYEWSVMDPSAFSMTLASQKSIADQFADEGIIAAPGDNKVEAGISECNEWLRIKDDGYPNVQVFNNLERFLFEVENYRFELLTPEQAIRKDVKERPVKKDDHLMDCFRYMIMSAPELSAQAEKIGLKKKSWIERELARRSQKKDVARDFDDLSAPIGGP
jgi:phage terminase large subunit